MQENNKIVVAVALVVFCWIMVALVFHVNPSSEAAPITPVAPIDPDRQSPDRPSYVKPCRIMSSITDKWVVIDARLKVVAKASTRSEAQQIADTLNAQ